MTRAGLNRQINSLLVRVGEINGINPESELSTMIAIGLLSVALDKHQDDLLRAATAGSIPAEARLPQPVAA